MKEHKRNYIHKIIARLFKNVTPFACDLYQRMDGSMFIIGMRFNKFQETGQVGIINSLAFFYGYNYKCFQWLD